MATQVRELKHWPQSSLEKITPEYAQELLKTNANNRPLRPLKVKMLAEEMEHWVVNGAAIVVATSGRLLDGQHRLSACVESGIPFWSYIVRDVEESVFDTIDQGTPRGYKDILHGLGEKNCTDLGRALTLAWRWKNGALGTATYPTNRERVCLLAEMPVLRTCLEYAISLPDVRNFMPRSLAAFLYFIGSAVNTAKVEAFLNGVVSGANLNPNSPILKFRNTAVARKNAKRRTSQSSDELVALAIKALQAHFEGREVALLRFNVKEAFPVFKG